MQTIGITTTYHGTEHRYLAGYKVAVIAVIEGAAGPDYDLDADDGYLTAEENIARRGGITADDRVEVQPWIEEEERFSFVSSDPRAHREDALRARQWPRRVLSRWAGRSSARPPSPRQQADSTSGCSRSRGTLAHRGSSTDPAAGKCSCSALWLLA